MIKIGFTLNIFNPLKYRSISLTMTQLNTDPPVLNILQNDFNITISSEYVAVGRYRITFTDELLIDRTKAVYFFGDPRSKDSPVIINVDSAQTNNFGVDFKVYDTNTGTEINSDGNIGLIDTYFEFRLYY